MKNINPFPIFKYSKLIIIIISAAILVYLGIFVNNQVLLSFWENPEDLIKNSNTPKKAFSSAKFDKAVELYENKTQEKDSHYLNDIFYKSF